MRIEQTYLVNSIKAMIGESDFCFFVTYAGLKVQDFSVLRKQLVASGADCHVLKNTLILKAAAALDIDLTGIDLTQSTALVYGKGDCGAIAKMLVDFGKNNPALAAKGGLVDGAVLPGAEVAALADLPSKDVLRAMLLGVLQAPPRNLVTVLNAKAASILNVINAYKEKLGNN
jgi:large subunit ribosomal protein L10